MRWVDARCGVRRGGGRRRTQAALDAVQASVDLRGDVQIRVGSGLTQAVLNARGGVTRRAQHTQHRAAVVTPPKGCHRRHGVGAKAAVAVDGGGAKRRHAACVRQQAGEPGLADVRQRMFGVSVCAAGCCGIAHEGVGAAAQLHQRVVQMPAAGHDLVKRRAAHEAGVVAGTAQGLLDAVSKQRHLVGGLHRAGGVEHGFDLARPELDFE